MKKVYLCIALCVMLLAALSINAQRNMFVRGDNGSVNAVEVSNVDYATIHPNSSWIKIINYGVTDENLTDFSAKCRFYTSYLISDVRTLSGTLEMGVCYSTDNKIPTVADQCKVLSSEKVSGSRVENTFTFKLESLAERTRYYFRPYLKFENTVFYGDVAIAETLLDHSCTINGHKFVDLHLPSRLLWAETNIGAETVLEAGDYFAWGETSPHASKTYSWDTYEFGTQDNFSKYNNKDGKTILDKEDDAAYVNWGDPCRMPTYIEFNELLNNCTWTLISKKTSSGTTVRCYEIKSKKFDNSILLPYWGMNYYQSSMGYYWCSTLHRSWSTGSININYGGAFGEFYPQNDPKVWGEFRYDGYTIRPVANLE